MPKLSQVVPSLARATLRAVAPSLAEKSIGPALPAYDTHDLIERLIVPVSEENPDIDAAQAIMDHCMAQVKIHNWLEVAKLLTELDQVRTTVPSGRRMLEVVLLHIRDSLSELYEAPNDVNFETSFVYSARVLDAIEACYLENPDNYMLAAILGRFHQDCAWTARGSKSLEDLDNPTKSILRDHTKITGEIVTNFDPIAYDSPLMAEVQYSYIAIVDPTNLDRLKCAFDDWAELDPTNLTPYRHHAFFVQNVHSERDATLFEAEARRAVGLAEDVLGAGAYTVMYLQSLKYDPSGYTYLDTEKFVTGFDDVMKATKKDPMQLTTLLEAVVQRFPTVGDEGYNEMTRTARAKSAKIRLALAPVIRQYVGVLYSAVWDLEETDFLHAIAPSFAEELARGATVELTEGGLLVTEANYAN